MKKSLYTVLAITLLLVFNTSAFAAKKTIGIIAFDGVLTSDITGPAEVFGTAANEAWFSDYEVKFIGINDSETITTAEGLTLTIDGSIQEAQQLSVLIVPSSYTMEPLLNNTALISFIQNQAKQADFLASNCSGSYLLAQAGLLDGKKATTWAGGEADLQKQFPAVDVVEANYVIDDNIITSNGSVVSYVAALKLLSLMTDEKSAQTVFDALQLGRLVSSY